MAHDGFRVVRKFFRNAGSVKFFRFFLARGKNAVESSVKIVRARDAFSALGLLIEATPFGRMMGNVYLRVARPGVPTRLFGDERLALGWLKGHSA